MARRAHPDPARASASISSFFVAPPDYQQGETVRIMFIHVPAAWLAMFGYMLIAASALGTLIWRHPLADVAAKTAAPIGATFCFIALVTGSLWGKPMWGTYWVWDARLTSMLVLFLLYLGLIALVADDRGAWPRRPRRRHPGPGRRRQRADHQILGRVVEHAAPAGEHRSASAARPSILRCSPRSSSWRSPSRWCSCCCI